MQATRVLGLLEGAPITAWCCQDTPPPNTGRGLVTPLSLRNPKVLRMPVYPRTGTQKISACPPPPLRSLGKHFTQHSQEHELHSHCQGLVFFLHTSQDEHEGRCVGDAGHCCSEADEENEGQHQAAAGRLTGTCRYGAIPCHTAAVGVEDLG